MWRLIGLSLVQSVMLSLGQLTLKLALGRMPTFSWSARFWCDMLTNWWFLASGILFGGASVLWMYILKHYPLNMAYPMASISYVIAIVFAVIFLHESVAWNRWLGVALIMAGCIFVAK
ncbi:EamA family transporter [uncultured Muribaculum sp.]|jgi:undecaprenyl phosphate-alpha-L-ara4N flippase subunit ArnE|uniref:EamA family transporter n=1 Tax=uncultured Muribaculum sp. TaxID=1918613 RepID=UPI00272992C3|nr:EamA family transporter [uncultured Muribaculum sp.]